MLSHTRRIVGLSKRKAAACRRAAPSPASRAFRVFRDPLAHRRKQRGRVPQTMNTVAHCCRLPLSLLHILFERSLPQSRAATPKNNFVFQLFRRKCTSNNKCFLCRSRSRGSAARRVHRKPSALLPSSTPTRHHHQHPSSSTANKNPAVLSSETARHKVEEEINGVRKQKVWTEIPRLLPRATT